MPSFKCPSMKFVKECTFLCILKAVLRNGIGFNKDPKPGISV